MRLRHATAAFAVAALYALLLQGFLGALAPAGPLAAAIHCVPGTDASGGPGQAPAAHDGACCLLACRALLAPPPVAALVPRLARAALPPRPGSDAAAGPAPAISVRARGPPLA